MKDTYSSQTKPASGDVDQDIESHSSNKKIFDNSVVRVIFKEEHFFKKYKSKIEEFFKELLEGEHVTTDHDFKASSHSLKNDGKNRSDPDSVPFYSTLYEDVLRKPEPELEEKKEETNKPQAMTCFNCLGDHHMKDCKETIDRQKVNENKKELLVSNNTSRYHEEERKNAIKPGCPSDNLRKALGLRYDQLPPYIYAMRVIGYPPGWMNDAVHETSGLLLYENSLDESRTDDDSFKMTNVETQYDSEKIVNYPGFNSPVPKGVKDEWRNYGWCPIQPHQQLCETLKQNNMISCKNVYKRKSQPSTSGEETKKSKSAGTNEVESCWSPQSSSTPNKMSLSHSRISETNCESPISMKSLSSMSKSPGTPIVGHGNPFCKLPGAEKFARDITEHLPFENLPDAVGKFENMRNVLSNVQKKLQDLKQKTKSDCKEETKSDCKEETKSDCQEETS